ASPCAAAGSVATAEAAVRRRIEGHAAGRGGAMVTDPGAKVRPHRLRPLATPRRTEVHADEQGTPHAVRFEGAMRQVVAVEDRWRIDDEWWRETAVSRMYYQLQLEDGRVITVYRDLIGGGWCEQRY